MTHRILLLTALAIPAVAQIQVEGGTRMGSRISAGGSHSCGIGEDGSVRCWGANHVGQIGDDSLIDRLFPVPVSGITGANPAISVAAGSAHTCALLADGTVRCWGGNTSGQLGNNSTVNSRVPVAVQGLTFIKAISAGDNHTCALRASGDAVCWGSNSRGQLGTGINTNSSVPISVRRSSTEPLGSVFALAAGGVHTCALLVGAQVFCWGLNNDGQLGTGDNTARSFATLVPGLTGTKAIAAGDQHTCALRFDATLRCWGENLQGQLGDNTQVDRNTPVPVQIGVADVKAVSAGDNHTCLLRATGIAVCWGQGTFGQIGEGNFVANRLTPQFSVADLSGAFEIEAGGAHTCAIRVDDSVRCWGRGNRGQIGDGGTSDRNASELALLPGTVGARALSAEFLHTCAVRASGAAACWGRNDFGQVGINDGTVTDQLSAVPVFALNDALAISTASFHTCALRASGSVSCWGRNRAGQLGDGTTTDRSQPVTVAGLGGPAIAIAAGPTLTGFDFTCALIVNGTVQCWGGNEFGTLGNGTTGGFSPAPQVVTGIFDAKALSTGANSVCVLRAAGSAACWGDASDGNLGSGNFNGLFPSPVPVLGLTDATGISGNCAVKVSGSVSCWGDNSRRQLGGATTVDSAVPVPIQNLSNAVTAEGGVTACAVRANGQVACWGSNSNGLLGTGAPGPDQPQPQTIPVVSGATTVRKGFGFLCALTATGQPFCWGLNNSGQLGLGDTASRFTPTPVPSFTFNVLAAVTAQPNGKKATVTALANCPEGARVRIDVVFTQGSVTGDGHANGDCTGRLERYAVDIHANGNTSFVPGAATATAEAEVRQQGQTLDNPHWTRAVTIQ